MELSENKLFVLIKLLNNNDLRNFKKFTKSDFVGNNKDVVLLFDYIFDHYPANFQSIDKQSIFKHIHGGEIAYSDLKIRHLFSDATRIIEDFIVTKKVLGNAVLKKQIMLECFLDKGLEKPAKATINELQSMISSESVHDAEYYRSRYELGVANYHFQSNNVRTEDFDYSSTVENFTTYAIIETLKSACTINTINKVMESPIRHPLLDSILQILPESDYLLEPLVRIYFHLFKLVEHEQEEVFESLLNDIKEHEILFSVKDLNTLFRTMINFCIKKSNQNNQVFTRKAFEIYIYAIESEILIEHQEINRFIFTNVITLGIKLGELDQSLEFLKTYQHLIHANYVQNTIVYNLAKIYYAQRALDNALKILFTNEFKDKIWNLNSKYLILKILFEQRELDTFRQQLSSFKVYVKRVQNVGYHKTYFEKIIQSLTILLSQTLGKKKYNTHIFDKETPDFEWFQKVSAQ